MGLALDAEGPDRYSRHVIADGVGPEGQAALLDAEVLVVGAGGLGAPIIQYLAAAGVGTLGVVDDDVVERSNLQRQVVHGEDDLGRPKVESAAAFVRELNPDVDVEPIERRVTPESVEDLVGGYDFVVDGTDNFRARYLVNDACIVAGIAFSHGAVFRFEGQATSFSGNDGSPCYRCLFPEAPPAGTVPDCATTGVLGVLPGTIGCIQATEAIKHLIGIGDPLDGRLVFFDGRSMSFDEVCVRKNPSCPLCREGGIESVRDVDYGGTCAIDGD